MSEISRTQALDRAVEFTTNQDKLIHSWVGRYLAIQSGLAVAVAAVINWPGEEDV